MIDEHYIDHLDTKSASGAVFNGRTYEEVSRQRSKRRAVTFFVAFVLHASSHVAASFHFPLSLFSTATKR